MMGLGFSVLFLISLFIFHKTLVGLDALKTRIDALEKRIDEKEEE